MQNSSVRKVTREYTTCTFWRFVRHSGNSIDSPALYRVTTAFVITLNVYT